MIAGRVKCDFCNFIGEMTVNPLSKGSVKVPDGWVSIHPHITVHGLRGLDRKDPEFDRREKMKIYLKNRVASLHACPGCVQEKDVFSMRTALPQAAERVHENYMRRDL